MGARQKEERKLMQQRVKVGGFSFSFPRLVTDENARK
jgi:hypothetical protein